MSALGRVLSPFRLASAGFIVLVAAVAILVTQGSNKYLEVPDNAHPLADLVEVPHAKADADGGGIYYVDVLLKPASLLESYVPYVRPEGSALIDRAQIVEPGISDQERHKLDLATMKASQDVASVVALRELGYRVPIRPGGVRIVAVTSGSHAGRVLRPGDVIVGADDKKVFTRTDLAAVLGRLKPGDTVKITVKRGAEKLTFSITTTADTQDPKRAIVGVLPIQALSIRLPFPIKFNLRKATGEIQLDGSVARIGGIKQKTIGARKSHVDVFLVPVDGDNARDAKRFAGGLRIIPVKSFQQALQALATLPPKG